MLVHDGGYATGQAANIAYEFYTHRYLHGRDVKLTKNVDFNRQLFLNCVLETEEVCNS